MQKWYPPGYRPLEAVVEDEGRNIYGTGWNPEVPAEILALIDDRASSQTQRETVEARVRNKLATGELVGFLLDPNRGPVELKPHWWFHDGRAEAAFREGVPLAEGQAVMRKIYGSGRAEGYIGVRIEDTRISATAHAERQAEPWLEKALTDKSFLKKEKYWQAAAALFPRLSKRGFARIWDRLTQRPEHSWITKPGPK